MNLWDVSWSYNSDDLWDDWLCTWWIYGAVLFDSICDLGVCILAEDAGSFIVLFRCIFLGLSYFLSRMLSFKSLLFMFSLLFGNILLSDFSIMLCLKNLLLNFLLLLVCKVFSIFPLLIGCGICLLNSLLLVNDLLLLHFHLSLLVLELLLLEGKFFSELLELASLIILSLLFSFSRFLDFSLFLISLFLQKCLLLFEFVLFFDEIVLCFDCLLLLFCSVFLCFQGLGCGNICFITYW